MTIPTAREPERVAAETAATAPKAPSTHLVFAIISTVLFWPVGLFAILKSVAARKALAANDLPTAAAAGRSAKRLSLVATCIGAAAWVASVLVIVATVGLAGSGIANGSGPYDGPGVATYDLTEGACFTAPTNSMSPAVPAVDCTQPHTGEVYNTVEITGDSYPGKPAIVEAAVEACTGSALTSYVGSGDAESRYTAHYLAPSEDFWNAGKRSLVCFLSSADENELTGSVRAAG